MSRRTDIADVAITTLAREGMRGLTHRAVDRAAGLPEGSTSYYFRTREAMLEAMVERLVEVDQSQRPPSPGGDLDSLAAVTAEIVHQWLTVDRSRQLARYELTLEASRRPQVRERLVAAGAQVRAIVADQLIAAGVDDAEDKAYDFSAYLDGLLFDEIAGAGRRGLTVDQLRVKIRTMLHAVTS
ncbi:TetR/AcrR family transcriptional regulator [Phytoactinopolyspora limicola]|uniref:TetR/AcrR family transcriptional regulator n=1 Tax=Phytoactinopolyspora limicola TaxID=2715536 RepID=UPI00140E17E5|nr:TetR family transcriptional regulator [Phytoactinopolyspora limicola]